jgi:DNA-binding NtrC family response regulator
MIQKNKQEEMLFGEKSYIALADKGTLFIENIHEASEEIQDKLLTLIRDNEFQSDFVDIKPDVRFIFSTTEDLKTLISLGKFSKEIFYKISVVTINIPPLRKRTKDIPKLARQILHSLNQKYGRVIYDFTDDAINKLKEYSWNGNIRELENVIDRSILNLENNDSIITSSHVPEIIETKENSSGTLKELVEEYEKKIIMEILEVCHGNKTEASKKLGLTVRNLYYKLDRYGIK